jgi:transposase-like protein
MEIEPNVNTCPPCQASDSQGWNGGNPSGSQRWVCKACGRRYTRDPLPNSYPEEVHRQVVRMCLEGQGFRSVARRLGVNPETVTNWINQYVARSARALYRLPRH